LIYQIAQHVGAFWFWRYVLAIQLSACADVTAWQSVTYLTLLPTLLFGYLTQPPNVIFMTAGSIYQHVFRPTVFGLLRLPKTLFTKKARRSVAHLTFANPCWRSVPTFLVLLRTEAGIPPAFQSAPLRGEFVWYNEGRCPVLMLVAPSGLIICKP
jgi:hypothetical protein